MKSDMPTPKPPYAAQFRQQMVELVQAGRTPGGRLDGADRGEAPLDDAGATLDIARDQLSVLGQIEHHSGRLSDPEAVVVDDRHLVKRADSTVGVILELAAGVVQRVDSVRQANLLERPLRPEVFRLAASSGKDISEA